MGRHKHSPELKKKVAIEALKDQKSLIQIAKKFQVHPAQVSTWRKQLLDCSAMVFEGKPQNVNNDQEEMLAILERKIGRLTIENDFLKKN